MPQPGSKRQAISAEGEAGPSAGGGAINISPVAAQIQEDAPAKSVGTLGKRKKQQASLTADVGAAPEVTAARKETADTNLLAAGGSNLSVSVKCEGSAQSILSR
eukprot:3483941-Pleurochrysis_carterae.AAC.2